MKIYDSLKASLERKSFHVVVFHMELKCVQKRSQRCPYLKMMRKVMNAEHHGLLVL